MTFLKVLYGCLIGAAAGVVFVGMIWVRETKYSQRHVDRPPVLHYDHPVPIQ